MSPSGCRLGRFTVPRGKKGPSLPARHQSIPLTTNGPLADEKTPPEETGKHEQEAVIRPKERPHEYVPRECATEYDQHAL